MSRRREVVHAIDCDMGLDCSCGAGWPKAKRRRGRRGEKEGVGLALNEHKEAVRLGYAGWHKRYAAPPGSGPEGETCGSCTHRLVLAGGVGDGVPVCGFHEFWTGAGARIALEAPACNRFGPDQQAAGKCGQKTDAATGVAAPENLKR
jgi:hypothetical protein